MKSEIYCATLHNILHLNFNPEWGELNINFTGNPKANLIAIIECPYKIDVFKQYSNLKEFEYLKNLKNCLDFNKIELVLTNNFSLDVLLKEPLQNKYYRERKIYLSCDRDLILWTILSVNKPFNLQRSRNEILFENNFKRNNRFNFN